MGSFSIDCPTNMDIYRRVITEGFIIAYEDEHFREDRHLTLAQSLEQVRETARKYDIPEEEIESIHQSVRQQLKLMPETPTEELPKGKKKKRPTQPIDPKPEQEPLQMVGPVRNPSAPHVILDRQIQDLVERNLKK